jgi:hypothetical protein
MASASGAALNRDASNINETDRSLAASNMNCSEMSDEEIVVQFRRELRKALE